MGSVGELKEALGTVDDIGLVAGLNKGQLHHATDDSEDNVVGPLSKKMPGEIIYRDSTTFLKVLIYLF